MEHEGSQPARAHAQPVHCSRRVRRNFPLMFIDALGWPLGWAFMAQETLLSAFLLRLSDDPRTTALMRTIYALGCWLPVLWAPNLIARVRHRGPVVVLIGTFERVPMLVIALAALALARDNPRAMLWVFFLCWAVRSLCEGLNLPCYSALLGEALPPDRRGRLWGISAGVSAVMAFPIGLWASANLKQLEFPLGYSALMVVGFAVLMLTVLPLGWVREWTGGRARAEEARSGLSSFRLLREDPRLVRFILASSLCALAELSYLFFTMHAIQTLRIPEPTIGWFMGAQAAAAAVAGCLFGIITDRIGYRRPWMVAHLFGLAACVTAWLAPGPIVMSLAFALVGVSATGTILCRYNMLVEMAPPGRSPKYIAVNYSIVQVAFAVAPLIGALLIRRLGTSAVFLPGIVLSLLTIVAVRALSDPRHEPGPHVALSPQEGLPS